jgi:hypothetical protein
MVGRLHGHMDDYVHELTVLYVHEHVDRNIDDHTDGLWKFT